MSFSRVFACVLQALTSTAGSTDWCLASNSQLDPTTEQTCDNISWKTYIRLLTQAPITLSLVFFFSTSVLLSTRELKGLLDCDTQLGRGKQIGERGGGGHNVTGLSG